MRLLVPVGLVALAPALVTAQASLGLLPGPPDSSARWVPIEAMKEKGPGLAAAFAPHIHRNARGEEMPYRLFSPARLQPGRTYPLVVFLHGAGGSGTDNRKQLEGANMFGALSWALPERQARHPAFVLAPQSDVNWACVIVEKGKPARRPADLEWCPTGVLGPGARVALEIVDSLLQRLPIDRDRIYVTGHSMGGAGTWHMIAHRPGFFAAAVPVCGHPDKATAGAVAGVPIWNFHGEKDDVEPVETSRRMIEALRKAGGHPRHTEYPGVGHNVFLWAYTEPALVEWVFAQRRENPGGAPLEARPHVAVRGIYGGVPQEILDSGRSLREFGLDAVWMGSGSFTSERMALLRAQGVQVYAEFNTLHVADYLKEHPDAAPVGPDGQVSPPPDGWQGICPSHEAYRRSRMEAFRRLVRDFDVDGVWLDYHHAHASWEQAVPNMPDTCFCDRCLSRFQRETGVELPDTTTVERARLLLSTHRETWVRWRCDLFTDWVREFKGILDATRPGALLGTFHNPWSDEDLGGARIEKLAIDLKAQAAYVDVFSPMPYHARFGHAAEPEWISRQVAWLGRYLGIQGTPGEKHRIWPIVQVSDWGEAVPLEQVPAVLDHGSRRPATGVMVFAWSGLRKQPEKIEAIGRAFRAMRGSGPGDR
jgi:poly(3-hydroxybutyrate) depolymerase